MLPKEIQKQVCILMSISFPEYISIKNRFYDTLLPGRITLN